MDIETWTQDGEVVGAGDASSSMKNRITTKCKSISI